MKDYIILLGGGLCILIVIYSILIKSRGEGFSDTILKDGDKGSDAWYEKGSKGSKGEYKKVGTRITPSVTSPSDRKEYKGQGSGSESGSNGGYGGSNGGSNGGYGGYGGSNGSHGGYGGSNGSNGGYGGSSGGGGGQAASPIKNTMNIADILPRASKDVGDITLDYKPPIAGVAEDATPAKLKPPIVANVNDRINEDICRNVMNCVSVKKQSINLD